MKQHHTLKKQEVKAKPPPRVVTADKSFELNVNYNLK